MDKQFLRQQLLQQREALSSQIWYHKSHRLCHQLAAVPLFQGAQTILAYVSFRQEPDLKALFANQQERHWGLPRCVGQTLIWHHWRPGDPLAPNQYGIPEPLNSAPLIAPAQVDLILVPAVGCDRRGYRLGYGGGYYDRLLSEPLWASIATIGIVFEEVLIEQLPNDPWDQKLTGICTDWGYISSQG